MTTLKYLLRAGRKLEGAAEDLENMAPASESFKTTSGSSSLRSSH